MPEVPKIPNFEILCKLLEKYKNATDEDSVTQIYEMYEVEGYSEWLAWMEKNRPHDLP